MNAELVAVFTVGGFACDVAAVWISVSEIRKAWAAVGDLPKGNLVHMSSGMRIKLGVTAVASGGSAATTHERIAALEQRLHDAEAKLDQLPGDLREEWSRDVRTSSTQVRNVLEPQFAAITRMLRILISDGPWWKLARVPALVIISAMCWLGANLAGAYG
jgi:hypothetical protein